MEEDESEFDSALLLDAAFQIIDASLNTKALFQELCELSRKFQENSTVVSMTDLLSVTCTQMQENKNGLSDESMLSTPALAQEVIRLAEKHKDNQSVTCQKKYQGDWRVCLGLIKESLQRRVFISSLFTSWISKRGLSIEFLWDLHKIGAYNFEAHLASKLKEPKHRTQLSQTLISLCQIVQEGNNDNSNVEQQKCTLTGVTNLFVNKSFMEHHNSRAKDSKMYLTILDVLLEGIIAMSVPSSNHLCISPFGDLSSDDVDLQAKTKFVRHALSFCLQHQADFIISEHTPTVTEYKPDDADTFLETLMKQLLECLALSESLDVLSHCLKCDQVNSRTTTAFLAAFLTVSELSSNVIIDYIKTNLATGLQESDSSQVTSGFYIARKCCSLSTVRFPSYRDWYQQVFGEVSSSIAISRTSFSLLIKCLTQWVPEDASEYLKAHILRRPIIPARMRDVYESYVLLAKTRLDDLKIPLRDVANQDASCKTTADSSKEQQMVQMQQDVDCSVKAYEETGKIPTTILEASIFRKPYFVGKFLPALLKPRCLPDRPDSRMRLIEEMRKSGRIPPAMFSIYKDGCEIERQNLLEGIFDVDDEGEEMLMSPMEQLQFRLDHLAKEFCQGGDKKVHESLSLVEERVHALVMTPKKTKGHDQDLIKVDLCQSLESIHEQIITKFISCLSCGLDSTTKHQQGFVWLDKLVAILLRFPVLKAALIKYILLCLDKTTVPEGASPESLSIACISIMCRSQHLSLSVTDQCGIFHNWNNFLKACDHFVSCCCEEEITYCLRFYMSYLFHVKQRLDDSKDHNVENADVVEITEPHFSNDQLLPAFLVKKITLLCSRCRLMGGNSCDTLGQSNLSRLHGTVSRYTSTLHSSWWKRSTSMHQPSLEDWVKFELRVNPSRDILAKRLRLSYFWEFPGKFIQDLGVAGVCSSLFWLLADEGHYLDNIQKKDLSWSKDDSFGDFISLLKGLLLQLPPGNGQSGRKPPWLLSTVTACQNKSVRAGMLSLSLHLHPHLLVCDNKHSLTSSNEAVDQSQNALRLLDLFSESDLNFGGYFSLDVIIFMIQACDSLQHSPQSQMSFLCHPVVFVSVIVHHKSLNQLGVLSFCPEDFKTQLGHVLTMAERLLGGIDSKPYNDDEGGEIDDWMKASALFGFIISDGSSLPVGDSLVNALSQQAQFLPFLLELITTWFACNINTENSELDSRIQAIHQSIVLRHPVIVTKSLTLGQFSFQSDFRQHLGHKDMHDFSILRLCSRTSVNTRDIPVSVCNALSMALISAYTTLLEGIESISDYSNKVKQYCPLKAPVDDLASISSWLQSLVDSCNPSQLYNIDLNILHTCDPLLYRNIYLKTLKS